MITIQDLITITTGTGTTGATIINGDGTTTGFNSLISVGIIIIMIIAFLIDRKLNQNLDKYPDQEQPQELYQNQKKIE